MKRCFLVAMVCFGLQSAMGDQQAYQALLEQHAWHTAHPSDINEHLPTLRRYAQECSTVVELGVRNIVSTWGLLTGLAENGTVLKSYIGVDIGLPEQYRADLVRRLATENGIDFQFWHQNDMYIEIEETDLLMIDTLHIYAQLTFELEKFSPKARKYIIMHDTSLPFAFQDCASYRGNFSEYPLFIDRTKRGLWPAVQDFLQRHPEWVLHERYHNNNGLTVLKRSNT